MKTLFALLLAVQTALLADVNVWHRNTIPSNDSLFRLGGGMVYLPDSDCFLLSMGFLSKTFYDQPSPYSEQAMSLKDTLWKNLLPAGKLGLWGDTVGYCDSVAYNLYFRIEAHNGIVRPSLNSVYDAAAYYQHAYDSDQKKVYYYIQNLTVSYDPASRAWQVLNPATDPAGGTNYPAVWGMNGFRLRWGAMAYDPVNREILLFGGGCASADRGSVGTWTYSPSTSVWTKLNLAVEPTPRALSPLVYDAKNQVIVLFSGDHLDSLLGDTWVYRCSDRTWVRKHPAISPRPRAGHAMLYLAKSRKVVMLGGYDYYDDLDDSWRDAREYGAFDSLEMWTYDVSDGAEGSWKLIKRFGSAEPTNAGTVYAAVAAADTSDRIVMIGEPASASRWYQQNLTWIMDCDPSQIDAAGTAAHGWKTDSNRTRIKRWDPAWFRQDDAGIDTGAQETALRNLVPNTFTAIPQPRYAMAGRSYGKAAIAPDRGIIFHWGGGHAERSMNDMPEYEIHNNRWYIHYAPETALEFGGSNGGGAPGDLTFNNHPTMVTHAYDAYDYCPVLKKLLLFHHRSTFLYNPDTKDWDTAAIPHHAAMVTNNTNRSLNATPRGMVAWSGSAGGNGLWLLDTLSLQWKPLVVKNGTPVPPYWCEHGMQVYDSRRDRVLLTRSFYGNPAGFDGQMWEYRFSDSTLNRLNPLDSALARTLYFIRDAVYLPATDQVLFQDTVRAGSTTGLGVYDCGTNRWKCAPVKTSTLGWGTSSNSTALLYDPKRDIVFIVDYANSIYALKYRDSSITAGGERSGTPETRAPGLSIFPNPFSRSVRISVRGAGSPAEGRVSLRVYDVTGRRAWDLPGKDGAFAWDPGSAPSGIYFVRLSAAGRTLVKKVLLAR